MKYGNLVHYFEKFQENGSFKKETKNTVLNNSLYLL